VDTSHLNIFLPYESKPLYHEDQLTRAFLVLVRSVKLVEAAFLELVATAMEDAGIEIRPGPLTRQPGGLDSVETQVWSSTKARLKTESGRLVSIIITDKKLDTKHRVERSNRTAVYDGFLKFRPDWVFVVENKPNHTNVWIEQLSSAFNENYEIEPTPIVLTWSEIITRLSLLVNNSLVQDTARILVEDFLAYVSGVFPELNPYDRLRLCGGNAYLLESRCVKIMELTTLGPVEYHRGWHYSIRIDAKPGVKEITLCPESGPSGAWTIMLDVHPGDTMTQARALYASVDVSKVASLLAKGWSVRPNFHVAYRSSNLRWAETGLDVADYIRYWMQRVVQHELRQVPRDEWDQFFETLEQDGVVTSVDASAIRDYLRHTRIPTLNVCPGLSFRFTWGSDEAMVIDDRSQDSFAQEVAVKVKEMMSCW
jgi:hypothetical protein